MDMHKKLPAAINGESTYQQAANGYAASNVVALVWTGAGSLTKTYTIVLARPAGHFNGHHWMRPDDPAYVYVGVAEGRFGAVRVGPNTSPSSTLVDVEMTHGALPESIRRELAVLIINVVRIARELKARHGGKAPDTATIPQHIEAAINTLLQPVGEDVFKLTLPE